MRLRAAMTLASLVLVAGCKRSTIIGLHCEGGVKNTGEGMGGECLDVRAETQSGDPATIGRAVWLGDYMHPLVVRRTGKNTYSLHRAEERVGTIEHDGNWIHVRFASAPPGSHTRTDRAYDLRSDVPGPLL